MKVLKFLYKISTKIILLAIIALGLVFSFSLLPIKNNFKIFSVQSGSMEPTISTGAVIFVKDMPNYEIGDIITRKNIENDKITITHRIVEKEEKDGETKFRTKGDANEDADSETFSKDEIVGKVFFNIPFIGYLTNFIKTTQGFILLVVIPATILVYEELRKIKKEIALSFAKRKEKKKATSRKNDSSEKESSDENEYIITSIEDNMKDSLSTKKTNEKKKV
jgi:signal peptidase I